MHARVCARKGHYTEFSKGIKVADLSCARLPAEIRTMPLVIPQDPYYLSS